MPTMYETARKEADALIRKAKEQNCWICGPTKIWYTPNEFSNLVDSDIITTGNRPGQYTHYFIADPKDEIRRRSAYAKRVNDDLQQYIDKVMVYFQFVDKSFKQ